MNSTIAWPRTAELRNATRYPLKNPAHFCWAPQDRQPQSGQGVTRDINKSGVYVLANELPQVGALVQLDILLRTLPNAHLGMHLFGDGVVVRVESHGATQGGFAASVHFYPQRAESVLWNSTESENRVHILHNERA